MKTEPSTFSWEDLVKKGVAEWDGVRNFEARNNMKKMKKGDKIFFYHSVGKPEIVGIAEVANEAHPDSTDTTGTWHCVDVAPKKLLKRPVTLQEVKLIPACKNMVLLKRSRLSVSPVTGEEWKAILNQSST